MGIEVDECLVLTMRVTHRNGEMRKAEIRRGFRQLFIVERQNVRPEHLAADTDQRITSERSISLL